jgi:hypothetical protein
MLRQVGFRSPRTPPRDVQAHRVAYGGFDNAFYAYADRGWWEPEAETIERAGFRKNLTSEIVVLTLDDR